MTKWKYDIVQGEDLKGIIFLPAPKTIKELEFITMQSKEQSIEKEYSQEHIEFQLFEEYEVS